MIWNRYQNKQEEVGEGARATSERVGQWKLIPISVGQTKQITSAKFGADVRPPDSPS